MDERLGKITPSIETIVMSPMSGSIQKLISLQLGALTEKKLSDLGYIGSACWLNTKNNTKMIVSKFMYDHITKQTSNGFGSSRVLVSELINLLGYFYYGNLNDYIYDIDVDTNTLIIKWHMDILLAYLTDTSMLDPNFKIRYQTVKNNKKKDKKNDHEPIILIVERSYRKNEDGSAGFCTEDIDEYFKRLLK